MAAPENQTKKIRATVVKYTSSPEKSAKKWWRVSIQSKAGDWYAMLVNNEKNLPSIAEGDIVELEFKKSNYPGSFDVVRFIKITASTEAPEEDQQPQSAKVTLIYDKALETALDEKAARRLKRAKAIVDKEFPEAKDFADYVNMVSEVDHQLYGEEASLQIAKSRGRG